MMLKFGAKIINNPETATDFSQEYSHHFRQIQQKDLVRTE